MVEKIEEYAKENTITIMEKEGIQYLKQYIIDHQVETILELGTAIGYSAIQMASVSPSIKFVTLERDLDRYQEAIKNIKACHLEEQITCHLVDAFDFETDEMFDLIFID